MLPRRVPTASVHASAGAPRRLAVATVVGATALAGRASAHGASLGAGARDPLTVPTWLFLATGGGVVGASFLLASFVTDRSFVARVESWGRRVAFPGRRLLAAFASLAGLAGLAVVIGFGFAGPPTPAENPGYLLVWVGWWAGFAMTTYLVGNAWPALNPWRTLAGWLPTLDRSYPDHRGAWPAVAGLLALVYLEVVGPPPALADALAPPAFVAALAVAYSGATLAGAVVYGDAWFERADPVSRVFRAYGRVAPLTRTDDGYEFHLPGAALGAARSTDGAADVAFVVALLWATTFDGFVSTPAWRAMLRPLGVTGWAARVVYLLAMVAGFALFWALFRLAVGASRDLAETHRSRAELGRCFAPPLLAIAAGYHLAHYLGYFLTLSPALAESFLTPLTASGSALTLALPPWFGAVGVAAILLAHLLAVWVAHATAFSLFPSRLQAIRSQYPFVAVMVVYTMTSLWILSQPVTEPPFL